MPVPRYGRSQLGRRPARDGRIRVRQPDRTAARRSRPACGLRRDRRQPARCDRATRCTASTTSTITAGRWTSSRRASGCAISSAAASASTSRATAIAVTTCCRSRTSSLKAHGQSLKRPAADVFRSLPPDAPARRQGRVHRRGHRPQRGDAGRRRLVGACSTSGSRTSSPTSATISRSSACTTTAGSRSEASPRKAPSIARSTCCGRTASSTRRTARSGSAPPTSATRRIAWSCATNGARTYFASDIAYHLNKRERGFEQLLDILGADHHGYLARVRAGLVAMGQPRGQPRGAAAAVRDAVSRRREGADVDALGRVRHAARAAQRSRQRRGALLLRDAQQRPAPRLRSRAGEVALERQPGLLHPVRARARVQRDAPARARRGTPTTPRRARVACRGSPSRTSSRCSPRSAGIRKSIELAALQRAPHTLVHYLRDLANDFHTYYNAHTFIVEDAPLRDARLTLVLGLRAGRRATASRCWASPPRRTCNDPEPHLGARLQARPAQHARQPRASPAGRGF